MGPAAAFSASITWAVGAVAYSKLSHSYPAYIVNLHRILVGLPAALLILTLMGGWGEAVGTLSFEKVGWALMVVLAGYALGDAIFLMSSQRIGGPASLAIASIYPLWSALWGAFFESEPLGHWQILGIVSIVGGVVAVILSGAKSEDLAPVVPRMQETESRPRRFDHRAMGVALALLASFFWALNSVAVGKLGQGMNPHFVNSLRLSLALILCPLIGVLMNGKTSLRLIPMKTLKPLLVVFGIECILGPFFYVYGLSHSSVAVGSALTALAPAISVPVAVAMGREKFSKLKTAGIFAVIAGIYLLLRT